MNYTPDVVIAKKFQYHRSWYKNVTRSKQSDDSNTEENEARENCFRLLKKFENEKITQQGEILQMSTLTINARSHNCKMGLN